MTGDREQSKGRTSPPCDERGRAGDNFRKAYQLDESSYLDELLGDIDEAYRKRRQSETEHIVADRRS